MSYPEREGVTLKPDAEAEYWEWDSKHGDRGCTCFVSPPCGSCTHPGNPSNLEEDDSAWVKEGTA